MASVMAAASANAMVSAALCIVVATILETMLSVGVPRPVFLEHKPSIITLDSDVSVIAAAQVHSSVKRRMMLSSPTPLRSTTVSGKYFGS